MGYNRSTSNFSCFSATSLASFNQKHGTPGEKGIVRIVGVEEIKELGKSVFFERKHMLEDFGPMVR